MRRIEGVSSFSLRRGWCWRLTDVLPVLGLSGAAIFLNEVKAPLALLGLVMTAAGVPLPATALFELLNAAEMIPRSPASPYPGQGEPAGRGDRHPGTGAGGSGAGEEEAGP